MDLLICVAVLFFGLLCKMLGGPPPGGNRPPRN